MYGRTVQGKTLTFGVSGLLWNRSLVMYDSETRSLWSHILGKAMSGKLLGTRLHSLPAVMTDWKSWRAAHPETTVLKMRRTSTDYQSSFQKQRGKFVLAIVTAGEARAYPFEVLAEKRVVNDQLQQTPVVVTFDAESTQARMYERQIAGRTLTFQPVAGKRMTDQETQSTWNAQTGACLEGPFKGQMLPAMAAIVSYAKAWRRFHPDSAYYR